SGGCTGALAGTSRRGASLPAASCAPPVTREAVRTTVARRRQARSWRHETPPTGARARDGAGTEPRRARPVLTPRACRSMLRPHVVRIRERPAERDRADPDWCAGGTGDAGAHADRRRRRRDGDLVHHPAFEG